MVAHIELAGSPHERGVAHGEALGDEIGHNAEYYFDYFSKKGVSKGEAREMADDLLELIEEENENYAAEMRGVAEGSGVALEDVTAINIRHTIIYSALPNGDTARESDTEGCTSFGLLPSITADGHTILGQNWDWLAPVELGLLDVSQPDGPDYLAVTEAGNVGGKFGCNEEGVGFCINALSTPEDGDNPIRTPAHLRGREILDAELLDEALDPVLATPRPSSRNYLLGQDGAGIIDVETAPEVFEFIHPEDGIVTHTNHFKKRAKVDSIYETFRPDTVTREMRVTQLFRDHGWPVCHDDIHKILSDHHGRPRSICRHTHKDGDEEIQTKVSVIMNLTDRTLSVALGNPCKCSYETFTAGA